jgi:hypothetical protein
MEFTTPKSVTAIGHYLLQLVLVYMLVTGSVYADDSAGQVILATGAVSAMGTDGKIRVLGKGSLIFSGDRVTTASKSLCVLKMIDDAKITIRADSEIIIEEYSFEGTSNDSSIMELVKGGFRTLTGVIGSNNPSAYKVNSDLSVLGIRGTDYDTRICELGNCIQIGGAAPKSGQYTNVTSGAVYMDTGDISCVPGQTDSASSDCVIDIVAGQIGFAALDELRILPDVPDFIAKDPTPNPVDVPETGATPIDIQSCEL